VPTTQRTALSSEQVKALEEMIISSDIDFDTK
jgi:hypothetical protein